MGVIKKKSVIYAVYILLAARAGISGIAPFGAAAYAAALISYDLSGGMINIILYAAACITGALLTGVWQQTVITAVTVLLFTVAYFFIKIYEHDSFPFALKCGAALIVSNIIPTVIIIAATDTSIMDMFDLIIQAAATFIMFFIYRIGEQSASDALDKNATKAKMSQEELACAAIIAIVALMGLPALKIFGLSIRNVISICIIMSFSLRGGIGTGAAAGIMIGIITNPASAMIITLYAFCGFLAGLLNRIGKGGVILAFALGNIILAAMLGGSREIVYGMYETGFSSILFMLLPKSFLEFIKVPFLEEAASARRNADIEGQTASIPVRLDYAGKIRNAAIRRAAFYSDALTEMSSEFIDISTAGAERVKEDPCVVRVLSRVCSDCKMSDGCWKRDYRVREKTLRDCRRMIEKDGDKKPGAISELSKFCIRPQDVIDEMRIAIEIQRTEKICNAKIAECRSLIVKQLGEMGKMSSHIADDIKYATNYDFESEKRIISALKKNEIYVYDAVVVKGREDLPEITLYTHKEYDRDKIDTITKIASKEIMRKMQLFSMQKSGRRNSMYELRFTVKSEISVTADTICMPASGNNISGDSFLFTERPDGSSYLILSDGMGTGKKAANQSGAAVHLMELYIKSGIDIRSAVSMVNMMLTSGASDVATASIDICRVDRHNLNAYFVKMGAMPSVVVGNESLKVIEINQPPAGVTSDISDMYCRITECGISKGDCIVMYTDGVFDAFKNGGINQKVFYEYMASVVRKYAGKDNRCHDAADEILTKAASLSENEEDGGTDDMSVAVIEIT